MTVRDEIHTLVDSLPDSELPSARRYLESLGRVADDPLVRFLREAPIDDEPTTPEEDREAEEAWQEYLRVGGISSDEIKRTLLS